MDFPVIEYTGINTTIKSTAKGPAAPILVTGRKYNSLQKRYLVDRAAMFLRYIHLIKFLVL